MVRDVNKHQRLRLLVGKLYICGRDRVRLGHIREKGLVNFFCFKLHLSLNMFYNFTRC